LDAICSYRQIFRWRTRCCQFASVTARLLGGRTTRHGFKVSSIRSESIATLAGCRSAIGVQKPNHRRWRRRCSTGAAALSHTLSHNLSHSLSHMTKGSWCRDPFPQHARVIGAGSARRTRARYWRRRCGPPRALSEAARRCGVAGGVLFRWKEEMMPAAAPTFVAVEITDADQERGVRRSCPLYPR